MGHEDRIKIMRKELLKMRTLARTKINETNQKIKQWYDKNTIKKDYKRGDVVFILNKTATKIGEPVRPLRPRYIGPYCVIKDFPATTLIQRISDGSQIICSKGDIKQLSSDMASTFNNIPQEILDILNSDYQTWNQQALDTIADWDTLDLPDIRRPDNIDLDDIEEGVPEVVYQNFGEDPDLIQAYGPEGSSTLEQPDTSDTPKSNIEELDQNNFTNPTNPILQDAAEIENKTAPIEEDEILEDENLEYENLEDNELTSNEEDSNLEDKESVPHEEQEPLDIDEIHVALVRVTLNAAFVS